MICFPSARERPQSRLNEQRSLYYLMQMAGYAPILLERIDAHGRYILTLRT